MADVLRTPGDRFDSVLAFPHEPSYVETDHTRMAYADVGTGRPVLCVHGMLTWSFLYRETIPSLENRRVLLPDLVGFGRSDKYRRPADHDLLDHARALEAFVESLDLHRATLVCQDWAGLVALAALSELEARIERLVLLNVPFRVDERGYLRMTSAFHETKSFIENADEIPIRMLLEQGTESEIDAAALDAYEAPFPSGTYEAAIRAFPRSFPLEPPDVGADALADARDILAAWNKPLLLLYGTDDPISRPMAEWILELVPEAAASTVEWVPGGHFLAEDSGKRVGVRVHEFLENDG